MEHIYSYTRKQAIEDGVLVEVDTLNPKISKEAGFKVPVAMTSTVYEGYINKIDGPGQSIDGRLWDLLTILHLEVMRGVTTDTIFFEVLFLMSETKHVLVKLKAVIGPGDTLDPVLTIMLPNED